MRANSAEEALAAVQAMIDVGEFSNFKMEAKMEELAEIDTL